MITFAVLIPSTLLPLEPDTSTARTFLSQPSVPFLQYYSQPPILMDYQINSSSTTSSALLHLRLPALNYAKFSPGARVEMLFWNHFWWVLVEDVYFLCLLLILSGKGGVYWL